MPLYEHVFLARQDASAAQVEQLAKEYTEILEQGGGKVVRSEYWGVKSLAYKIKKSRKAHYTMLNIDGPSEAVDEMERRMRLATDMVIRFMTVRVEQHENEPSVMMRKQDRDERGGRGGRGERRGPRGDRSGDRGDRGDRGGDRGDRGGDRGDRGPRGPRGDRFGDRDSRDSSGE